MIFRYVSVIVTTFNRPLLLGKNINALLNQVLDPDVKVEIIIVDDFSTDQNRILVSKIASQNISIRLILNSENRGRSASRNNGFSKANGQYILFLDDDILPEPNYIMAHLNILSFTNEFVTVGSLRFPPDLTKKNNLMKYLSSRELRQRKFDDFFLNDLPASYLGSGICGMHANDFKSIGGFNESFIFYGGEDVQLGLMLKQKGKRIKYVSDAKADHYDTVEFERYRIKFMEAAREGVSLILTTDKYFYKNDKLRFLFPLKKHDQFLDLFLKFFIPILINKYSEIVIRNIAKLTNRYSILYSKYLYHFLFACWMYAGLRDNRTERKSEVIYSD